MAQNNQVVYDVIIKTTGNTELQRLQQEVQKFTEQVNKAKTGATQIVTPVRQMGTGFSSMRGSIQNVAFQLQDFAVQVAGGTSASRAMSQQLPQLLSAFGLFGTIAGTAAAILVPLAANFLTAGKEAKSFKDSMKEVESATGDYKRALADLKTAMNDPSWNDTAFGRAMTRQMEFEAASALQKTRAAMQDALRGIASDFSGLSSTITSAKTVLDGVDKQLLSNVNGIKLVRNQFRDGSKDIKSFYITVSEAGETFVNLVAGMRNFGTEANQAAKMAKALMDALKSGNMSEVATALDAVSREIERAGIASGKSQAEIDVLKSRLGELISQSGGVVAAANANGAAFLAMGNNALIAAKQVLSLVSALSGIGGGLPQTIENLWGSFKGSTAVAGATKLVGDFQTNLKAMPQLIKNASGVKDLIDPTRELTRTQQELDTMLKAGLITTKEYAKAMEDAAEAAEKAANGGKGKGGGGGGKKGGGGGKGGIKGAGDAAKEAAKAMKDAQKDVKEFGDSLKSIAEDAVTGLVDGLFAIAEGSKSAKEVFADMAKSMLKQIAQLIVQMLILKPLMASLGGGGGLLGGILGGVGRSAGGVTRTTGAAPMVSPGAPVMRAATIGTYGGGSAANMNTPMGVTVNNYSNANVKTRQDNGQITIDIIEEVVADRLTRGGNRIDQAMSRAYGARRVGY